MHAERDQNCFLMLHSYDFRNALKITTIMVWAINHAFKSISSFACIRNSSGHVFFFYYYYFKYANNKL